MVSHNWRLCYFWCFGFLSSIITSECRSKRETPSLYPHARGILDALKEKGVDIAIASRSPTPDIAKAFLDKLEIKSLFVAQVCLRKTFSISIYSQADWNWDDEIYMYIKGFNCLGCWNPLSNPMISRFYFNLLTHLTAK